VKGVQKIQNRDVAERSLDESRKSLDDPKKPIDEKVVFGLVPKVPGEVSPFFPKSSQEMDSKIAWT
jgi:hypothetical protein